MSILEAAKEALKMLNLVEVRGESNIAAISRSISLIKAIADVLEHAKEESHDTDDKHGSND